MEKVLVTMLTRNSGEFLNILDKQLDSLEETNKNYQFDYLFLTNDNEDDTVEKIKKMNRKIELVEKKLSKKLLNSRRTFRLKILRQELLELTRKKTFDYLLMIDDEIFFNGKIFETLINNMKKNNLKAFGANTLKYNLCHYYDWFAFRGIRGEDYTKELFKGFKFFKPKLWLETLRHTNKHIYTRDKLMKVKSCFGGFFLVSKEIILDKDINYTEDINEIEKIECDEICEHVYYNDRITEKGYDIYIDLKSQPIYGEKSKYDNFTKIMNKNQSINSTLIHEINIGIIIGISFIFFLSKKSQLAKYFFSLIFLVLFFGILYFVLQDGPKDYRIGNKIVSKITSNTQNWSASSEKWMRSNPLSYSIFWKQNKEIIYQELVKQFGKVKEAEKWKNIAVLHFRCSDVPFEKNSQYHLLPKEYYHFVAEQLKNSNIKKMIVFNCMNHRKLEISQKKCPEYLNIICDWISEKCDVEIDRKIKCISTEETYRIMMSCGKLISTGGSFSFIPGITKDKDFISPNLLHEKEVDNKRFSNLSKEVHWTMWGKNKIIKHEEVIDYSTFDYKGY